MYTNCFISPSLNMNSHSFVKMPGLQLTTPRGSLNVQHAKLNLTGYRRESERLNFPMASLHSILDSALFWTQTDFNQETRREIEALLIQDNFKELTKLFKRRVGFNFKRETARDAYAIRSKIGAGFSRINPLTVQQIAHAVVDFVINYIPRGSQEQELFLKDESITFKQGEQSQQQLLMQELLANKGIVLGYDSKTRSCTIAKIFAAVLRKYGGVQIHWIDKFTTHSFLSYYTRVFGSVMGIMISCDSNNFQASHSSATPYHLGMT